MQRYSKRKQISNASKAMPTSALCFSNLGCMTLFNCAQEKRCHCAEKMQKDYYVFYDRLILFINMFFTLYNIKGNTFSQ